MEKVAETHDEEVVVDIEQNGVEPDKEPQPTVEVAKSSVVKIQIKPKAASAAPEQAATSD